MGRTGEVDDLETIGFGPIQSDFWAVTRVAPWMVRVWPVVAADLIVIDVRAVRPSSMRWPGAAGGGRQPGGNQCAADGERRAGTDRRAPPWKSDFAPAMIPMMTHTIPGV